jgi:small subunit ribosomal protein S16
MVRIRLTRMGAKKRPFYRIVAVDQRFRRDGRCIEQLGWYDPMRTPSAVKVDLERVDYWMGVGAQPSDTVARLISKARTAVPEAAPEAAADAGEA